MGYRKRHMIGGVLDLDLFPTGDRDYKRCTTLYTETVLKEAARMVKEHDLPDEETAVTKIFSYRRLGRYLYTAFSVLCYSVAALLAMLVGRVWTPPLILTLVVLPNAVRIYISHRYHRTEYDLFGTADYD